MKKNFILFCGGLIAAASMPHAGWLNFVYDLTPYLFTFIFLSWSLYFLFQQITAFGTTRTKAATMAFVWSYGYFLMGLNWVGNALLVPGNDYAWAWPLAFVGLPLILAPFLAVTFFIFQPWLLHVSNKTLQIFTFSALFTLSEFCRGHFFTGFPWLLPGMFWAETLPVFQILAIIGIYGLTFLTIVWAITCGLVVTRQIKPWAIPAVITLVTLITVSLYGTVRLNSPPPKISSATDHQTVQIVMVQANIPQSEKWNGEKLADHFYTHLALSEPKDVTNKNPAMIIWPETALSPNFIDAHLVKTQISNVLKTYPPGSVLITGALRTNQLGHEVIENASPSYFNSVIIYHQDGTVESVYDKHHLVPFGEYIPFQNYIPLAPIAAFTGLTPGLGPKTITLPNLPAFSPLVCYEIIFSGQTVAHDESHPRLVINLTNDGWYGNSPGPYQHLMEARARAIEENLPIVRVAGTGISAIFDQHGRILKQISYNQSAQSNLDLTFW